MQPVKQTALFDDPSAPIVFTEWSAVFGPLNSRELDPFRYRLRLVWDASKKILVYVMLNPSTADDRKLDPTVKACIAIAQRLGFGGIEIVNLFGFRSSSPADLRTAHLTDGAAPVGTLNDHHIKHACTAHDVGLVVAAWGNDGDYMDRAAKVRAMLKQNGVQLYALAFTQSGQPRHPLARGKHRIPPTTLPVPYDFL